MSKAKDKTKLQKSHVEPLDTFSFTDQPEYWDIQDPADQSFWDEFFRIEESLAITDDVNPPQFSITVQNHQTGEVRTYSRIHLAPTRKKILC